MTIEIFLAEYKKKRRKKIIISKIVNILQLIEHMKIFNTILCIVII